MDFEYGCATVNKFAFLDENEVEDPSDLLAQVSLTKDTKKTKDAKKVDSKGKKVDVKKTSGKDAKKPLQSSDNAVKKNGDKSDSGKKNYGDRQQKSAGDLAKENRGPRSDRPRSDRPPRQEGEGGYRGPRRSGESGYRGPRQNRDAEGNVVEGEGEGYRGNRGPRQGNYRGGNGGNRGPRREGEEGGEVRRFDRHSGSEKTGVKAVDKKDGAGKGNWGTVTDEVVIEENLATVEGENKDWAERVDENEEKKEGEVPEEETPNFMTLEEYKALKSQINKRNDFNIRRPGEGEDQSKWGKTYVLPKKADEEDEEEEDEEEEEEEEEEVEDIEKKNLIKSMQSAFKFESTAVPSGGRSDRGRGGQRGGARGNERRDYKPKNEEVTDTAAIPASETTVVPVVETSSADITQSPAEKKGNFGGQRGAQRGGQRGGRQSGNRPAQKSAPKFDDEKDFPTLGK